MGGVDYWGGSGVGVIGAADAHACRLFFALLHVV
jgi:hypothetical protein